MNSKYRAITCSVAGLYWIKNSSRAISTCRLSTKTKPDKWNQNVYLRWKMLILMLAWFINKLHWKRSHHVITSYITSTFTWITCISKKAAIYWPLLVLNRIHRWFKVHLSYRPKKWHIEIVMSFLGPILNNNYPE